MISVNVERLDGQVVVDVKADEGIICHVIMWRKTI